MYPCVFEPLITIHSASASATSVIAQPACPEPQRLPSVEADPYRNYAKSPGNAVLCEGSTSTRQLRCRSREAGSSSKLCQTFYRRRTQVWRMDLSEVGAELGSCWGASGRNLIGILQNQPEVANSYQDRGRQEGYDGEVGRQGHPQNFVGPPIEGEQKFWGWICPNWA